MVTSRSRVRCLVRGADGTTVVDRQPAVRKVRLMSSGIVEVPRPVNEPVHTYAPDTAERQTLTDELKAVADSTIEAPHIIA
jgi:hypothetical protein